MASITLSVSEEFKDRIISFPWVNWSEISREESRKKEIFERFIKTGTLTNEDQEFCDSIDWYPVDELPLREEYVKKLKKIEKGLHSKAMNLEELDKWFDKL